MELLKTTGSQLLPLLQSVSPAARIVAAIVLLCGLGSGLYYYNQCGPAESVCLFGGRELAATEIAAVETALGKAGLDAYVIDDNRVLVPQDQRAAILRAIDEAGATPRSVTGWDSQQTSVSPFLTGQQQRNQEKAKKQEKICAMIREIQGIEYVLVEYDETRSEGFPRTTERTAAVNVRPAGGRHLEPFEIKTIRATVQRAVAGLQPEDIVVIDGNSGIAHDWQDQESGAGTFKDYVTAKQYHEDSWKQKIESVLKCYPGVRVNVQVEFVQEQKFDSAGEAVRDQESAAYESSNLLAHLNAGRSAETAAAVSPGSNGHARVQADVVSVQKPTLPSAIAETNPFAADQRDYIPTSASVSIGVPANCVRMLATAKLSQPLRSEQDPLAENAGLIPALSQSQVNEFFAQIRTDIIRRVSPLLLGQRQANDETQHISVSLDPEVASVGDVVVNPDDDGLNYFTQFKSHWYAWLIPAVVVAGVILVRIGNRTHLLPDPANQTASVAPPAASQPTELRDAPNVFQEILHNDLEPTEKELQLATDIDRAFESDYQASLSSELVEMVEHDPRATISVFRSWLTEAA